MRYTYLHVVFLALIFLIISSCSDEIKTGVLSDNQPNIYEVKNLIEYAKEKYQTTDFKTLQTRNNSQKEIQWSDYKILMQKSDTLVISIPAKIKSGEDSSSLIVTQTKLNKNLFFINAPAKGFYELPTNIRRRVIVYIDGLPIIHRIVMNKKGRLQLVRMRDISTTRTTLNGGMLPEVVIYPGIYEFDWWWWDYVSGIISSPPPPGYSGYTGNYSNDNRPTYYNSENILKSSDTQASIKTLWKNTKNDASKEKGRRERGFWVYYDTKTEKYYTGKEKVGSYIKGDVGTKGSISPGSSQPKYNGDHIPISAKPVTFVHTHTPLSYSSDSRREVGLSQADKDYADKHNIDVIVIDYVGTRDRNNKYYIESGHDIDDPMKEYTYSPKK